MTNAQHNTQPVKHRMSRRNPVHDYSRKGVYHVTLRVPAALGQPFGVIVGDADTAHVELTAVGAMVADELCNTISRHYPMVSVDTYVVMPEHLHAILLVKAPIVSRAGKETHLGHVISGFKYGCCRRWWQLLGLPTHPSATPTAPAGSDRLPSLTAPTAPASSAGRPYPTLFAKGYCDVQPLDEAQLEQQRTYIKDNPRSRWLRTTHRDTLQARRGTIATALTPAALCGYLRRECGATQADAEALATICDRLLVRPAQPTAAVNGAGVVVCDSYGDLALLAAPRLLPVVCHRRDVRRFAEHKAHCLEAAQAGAVLVSARIAKGEQDIIDSALAAGHAVVLVVDNGFPDIYHPSAARIEQCLQGRLLLVSPWRYEYRRKDDAIGVPFCKTMNCVAQALCRTRDSWWKSPTATSTSPASSTGRPSLTAPASSAGGHPTTLPTPKQNE